MTKSITFHFHSINDLEQDTEFYLFAPNMSIRYVGVMEYAIYLE